MDISKILILALATAAVALFMTPAGAFIGVG